MRARRVFAALLLAGCAMGGRRAAEPGGKPEDALRKLEEVEAAARKDPSQLARAGWLRYLIASDPRGASAALEAGSRQGSPAQRALALSGLAEIAEDRTDSLAATRLWISALQAAPAEPVAELAAVRLLDMENESPRDRRADLASRRFAQAPGGPPGSAPPARGGCAHRGAARARRPGIRRWKSGPGEPRARSSAGAWQVPSPRCGCSTCARRFRSTARRRPR